MGMESWFKKGKPVEAHESEHVIDPTTGAVIGEAETIDEAKKKMRQHFEDMREAA